jgi:hypothetical protein
VARKLGTTSEGRAQVIYDAWRAAWYVRARHRLGFPDKGASVALRAALEPLSDDERRFVDDLASDRLDESGSVVEIIGRHFGPFVAD